MPKETFFNLEPDKRDRLMRIATAEFAGHDYASANLDRIALGSKIPKGSLYQYFDGKEDFYVHTVRTALDEAWSFFEQEMERVQPQDCFELLLESMLHMADLKKKRPHLATLYARVVYVKDTQSRSQLFENYLHHSTEFYNKLIPWGIEEGLLDPELPETVIRFHMSALGRYFQYLVLTDDIPSWLPLEEDSLRGFATQLINTLKHALSPQRSSKPQQGDTP